MKRLIGLLAAVAAISAVAAVPVYAVNDTPGQKVTSSTTLDACGYFVGTQTANKTVTSGSNYSEKGTWTGVTNNYVNTPVASLGAVTGSYSEAIVNGSDGSFSGTETFHSDAGTINQTFAFTPGPDGGFAVTVTATGALSFLTSDTNGACYSGPFPRP
jgi:hypothetical protein